MPSRLIFPDLENSPALTGSDNCSCHEHIWQDGHIINLNDYDLSNLEFVCETLPEFGMTDFVVTDLGCPIVSSRLKDILEVAADNINYYPARIIERVGEPPLTGYFAANIIGMIDCIDFEKSELEVEEEDGEIIDIDDVETLVLKEQGFARIYRMHLFERVIVADEKLSDMLISSNISGMKLVEPEKWDGFVGEK